MIKIIYPENRLIDDDKIMTWAHDSYYNKETDYWAQTVFEAVSILEHLGHITCPEDYYYEY